MRQLTLDVIAIFVLLGAATSVVKVSIHWLQMHPVHVSCRELSERDFVALKQLYTVLSGLVLHRPPILQHLQAMLQDLIPTLLQGQGCQDAQEHIKCLHAAKCILPLILDTLSASRNMQTMTPHPAVPSKQPYCGLMVSAAYIFCTIACKSDTTKSAVQQYLSQELDISICEANMQHAETIIQKAFCAVLELVQSAAYQEQLDDVTWAEGQEALNGAFNFLLRYRTSQPAVVDAWWSVYGVVARRMVAIAMQPGMSAPLQHALNTLQCLLCRQDTTKMLIHYLLVHPLFCAVKDGFKQAFALLSGWMQHDVPAFLQACCAMLRPESNQPLGVRIAALQGMAAFNAVTA